MKRVSWSEVATHDLRDIRAYLAEFSPDLADDTVRRAILATEFLLDFPNAGERLVPAGWRRWRVPRTRYLLIYKPTRDGVEIGRVRHDRSDWRLVPV